MVYYSSSLGKIRFNRNILYCKYDLIDIFHFFFLTFNRNILYCKSPFLLFYLKFFQYLIETFCIVNSIEKLAESIGKEFNRNILYCKYLSPTLLKSFLTI